MSSPKPLICLVTPGHIASTPRLVREADALVAAGYRVHVVAGRHYPPADALDESLLASAPWAHTRVDARPGSGPGLLARKLLRRAAQKLVTHRLTATVRIAARAHHAESLRLSAAAEAVRADLYIGHCLAGLPAAALAAQRTGARAGFDIEDFHDAETTEAATSAAEQAAARILQSRLLPTCSHLTVAAPLIGARYRERYHVNPRPILNVFPLSQAPVAPVHPPDPAPGRPAQLYWFSQTIGRGRGLEAVVAMMGRMKTPTVLHVRGFPVPGYGDRLRTLAREAGLAETVVQVLPPGPADEMARLAAGADLGLSTEESEPLNRDICLTNKVFVYLLAGIPQLLSNTSAQRLLAPELGEAALLADLRQVEATARQVDAFLSSPIRRASARGHAWALARRRFCWDVEQRDFVESVATALGHRAKPAPAST